MSENLEQQTEELEALLSIYEGDEFFKQINSTTFQYKYGDIEGENSFNVEIVWHESYPTELPKISLDTYYNKQHEISEGFKNKIVEMLKTEGETWIGCGMTYTLFESLKENITDLLSELEEELKSSKLASVNEFVSKMQIAPVIKTTEDQQQPIKKEQLTKSQKRRMWDRTEGGAGGARVRGWDWVDIVKHLSQTGGKEESSLTNIATNVTQQSSLMSHPLN